MRIIGTMVGLEAASENTQPLEKLNAQHSFSMLKKHYLFLHPENIGMVNPTVLVTILLLWRDTMTRQIS